MVLRVCLYPERESLYDMIIDFLWTPIRSLLLNGMVIFFLSICCSLLVSSPFSVTVPFFPTVCECSLAVMDEMQQIYVTDIVLQKKKERKKKVMAKLYYFQAGLYVILLLVNSPET